MHVKKEINLLSFSIIDTGSRVFFILEAFDASSFRSITVTNDCGDVSRTIPFFVFRLCFRHFSRSLVTFYFKKSDIYVWTSQIEMCETI